MNDARNNAGKRTLLSIHFLILAMLLAVTIISLPVESHAQVITATLNGTVTDPSGAVVHGAKITLKNDQTGDIRTTASNARGFFHFAAVPSGDYSVAITAEGFEKLIQQGIHLDPEDSRTLPGLSMHVGAANQTVTVTAESSLTPVDSGERSTLLAESDIKHLSVEGRDVSELVKTLPGFAINVPGKIDNAAYDPGNVSVTGALQQYAAEGNAANTVAELSDGAYITDVGAYGNSTQTVNMDMVSEVKVLTSNFGADTSQGPIVVNAVGKSGGEHFHGAAYVYGRTHQMNSQDWLSKFEKATPVSDHYVYPGFNLSGPVIIPGTEFNRNKKLTFFVGLEDYAQRSVYPYDGTASSGLMHALVPTQEMRNGDFSPAAIAAYLGGSTSSSYGNISSSPTLYPDGGPITGGMVNTAKFDPGALALMKTIPLPNRTNLGDGYNYLKVNTVNNDLYQGRVRIDYAISDNTKLFGSYNIERGVNGVPEIPYYSPAQYAGMGGVNTPGGFATAFNSHSATINLVSTFSASLTNELFVTGTYFTQTFVDNKVSQLTAQGIGYPYQGIYPTNGSKQYPQLGDYGNNGLPLGLFPDFSYGNPFARKYTPAFGDNLNKVVGSHTLKFGVYVQRPQNNQLQVLKQDTNGQIQDYWYPGTFNDANGTSGATIYSSGNYLTNFMFGEIFGFEQQNKNVNTNLYFWNVDWYGMDSWKVSKKLTVNAGLRFEHLGTWNDAHGLGLAVFNPAWLSGSSLQFPGFQWHAMNHSIPNSGISSKWAFVEPRIGFAYDVWGNGKTLIRGGWGEYRGHDSWNQVASAAAQAQGIRSSYECCGLMLASLHNYNLSATSGSTTATAFGLDSSAAEQPRTDTYSLTISQQLPWKSQFEIAYMGNNSNHLTAQNTSSSSITLENVNPVPLGAFFRPDPVTGAPAPSLLNIDGLTTGQTNDYRKYPGFGAIIVPRHVLYSNYNALQATWNKRTGRILYGLNYTWSKAMGIKDGYYNGAANDANTLRNNYGVEAYDRSHLLGANYTLMLGSPMHHNEILKQVVNGWSLSGVTTIQSGANLQATASSNFGLNGKIGDPAIGQLVVDNKTFLGTPDVQLEPILKCNPAGGGASHQFINANCFALPQVGGPNGPFNMPYIHGPAYFSSDLTAAKNFHFGESQNIEFRAAAFNFLNHALTSFTGGFSQETSLNMSATGAGTTPTSASGALAVPAPGFGIAAHKEGRRVVEMALKYTF